MLRNRLELFKECDVHIVKRHPLLLSIEGSFKTEICVDDEFRELYNEYINSQSRLSFTKWLSRYSDLSNDIISQIGKSLKQYDVRLSCRHNDLMRVSDTKHYISCLRDGGMYAEQRLHFLADRDIAVCYIPDASGKFLWRSLVRLVTYQGKFVLVLYKVYGNGPTEQIMKALRIATGLEVYPTFRSLYKESRVVFMKSASKIQFIFLESPIWSDVTISISSDKHMIIPVYIPLETKGERL